MKVILGIVRLVGVTSKGSCNDTIHWFLKLIIILYCADITNKQITIEFNKNSHWEHTDSSVHNWVLTNKDKIT